MGPVERWKSGKVDTDKRVASHASHPGSLVAFSACRSRSLRACVTRALCACALHGPVLGVLVPTTRRDKATVVRATVKESFLRHLTCRQGLSTFNV